MEPMQFCQTGTSTAPAEHPGRMYDITLPINPGFAVASLTVDAVTNPAGITWEVDDPDGAAFTTALQTFIQGRVAGSTVTITNPNAGTPQVCGTALPMQIHIECLRLDQDPPNLIELIYNAGRDMVQNAAYNEFPALNPPAAQGNYGFRLLARQDDPGPFPINQPAGRVLCTTVANRGWETNDVGRTFEIWGQDITSGANVTPTPRGTPVQEMSSDGPPPGARSTIWQTFQAPSSGNFNIRVVHGARDPGENHRITLTPGDTGDVQGPGAIINDVTTPPSVTSNGGPNPWTTFSQSIPLVSGQTYTLALSSNNPAGPNRGGLFTDMRAFLDVPDQRATAVNDDDTCVVTATETTTTTTCTFWQPTCTAGAITGWTNVQTGLTLTNALFWAQTPSPSCCSLAASGGDGSGGGTTNANLAVSDTVCVVVGGIPSNAIRVVVLDPSGGQLSQQFLGPDGFPVTPDSWVAGACTTNRTVFDVLLCDTGNRDAQGQPTVFLRKYVQSLDAQLQGNINSHRDFMPDGSGTYTVVGPVRDCASFPMVDREAACWTTTAGGTTVFTGTIRHDDALPAPGWLLFDQNITPVPSSTPGLTFIPCGTEDFTTTGLCLGDGTPIGIINRRTGTGTIVRDGWTNLLTGAFSVGSPPPGASACGSTVNVQTSDVLCDIDPPTGDVLQLVLIQYNYNPDGSIASTDILDATTGLPYTPVGNITVCPTDQGQPDRDMELLCDVLPSGTVVSIVRDYIRDVNGIISGFADYLIDGSPYTTVGTVSICIPRDVEGFVLCDSNGTRFLRSFLYAPTGGILNFSDATMAGAPFTPVGAVGVCPVTTTVTNADADVEILCDLSTGGSVPFLRSYIRNAAGAIISFTDNSLTGGVFAPGAGGAFVTSCRDVDTEIEVLCDVNAGVSTPFLRRYSYSAAGLLVGSNDTTLAGAGYTPTGTVGMCGTSQADTDFVEEVLCDANGTSFIRLFRFNSATGALISTTNTTLAGAAFTPVGAVGLCSSCCPSVVGNGCSNTGSGTYVAIRATNGTVSLFDSVTGAAITSGNVVPCPSVNTVVTLTSEARLVADADAAWTPGADVVGTLTSVTMTVLSGTANLVDSSGTTLTGLPAGLTLTWEAEDHDALTGPQSIDAIGGQTVINWTRK